MKKSESPVGESKLLGIAEEEPEDLLILKRAYDDFVEIVKDGGKENDKN